MREKLMVHHRYVYYGNLALYQLHNGSFTSASSCLEYILNYGYLQTAITFKSIVWDLLKLCNQKDEVSMTTW